MPNLQDLTTTTQQETQTSQTNFVKDVLFPSTIILAVILGGIGTGWLLNKITQGGGSDQLSSSAKVSEGGKEVGIDDTATFRDSAEGTLEKGGIDGEGTHRLIRTGGESQTAYLTSSVIDLDQFVGKKVQVWGETFQAKKAGWLMDVGKIKILE